MAKIEVSAQFHATEPQMEDLQVYLGSFQTSEEEISTWRKTADILHDIPQSNVKVHGK
jgi:hypothetical protein